MADGELWTILVYGPTILLRVDISLSRTEPNLSIPLRSAHSEVLRGTINVQEAQVTAHFVTLRYDVCVEVQAVIRLPDKAKPLLVVFLEHVDRLSLEVDKKVILTVLQEFIGDRSHVV